MTWPTCNSIIAADSDLSIPAIMIVVAAVVLRMALKELPQYIVRSHTCLLIEIRIKWNFPRNIHGFQVPIVDSA